MVARRLLPLLIVAMLSLAGCVSDDDTADKPQDGPGGGDGTTGTGPTTATAAGTLRFPFPEDATNTTRWANGTFETSRSRFPVGMTTEEATGDQPWLERLDIIDDVPRGGPVRVVAEVNAETTDGGWPVGGDLDLWLETSSENWISGSFDAPYGGYTRFEVLVWKATDDPIEVVLQYDESDSSQEFDYTLQVDIAFDPTLLPLDTPVAVALEPGSDVTVTAEDGSLDLLVWDPDDAFLGRFSGGEVGLAVSPNATAGEHVVMAVGDVPGFRVRPAAAVDDAVALRLMTSTWEDHEWHPLDDEGHASWTFDAEQVPLQARVEISNHEDVYRCADIQGRLEAPGGEELLSRTFGEPACSGIGTIRIGWWSDRGDPALTTGTYSGTVYAPQTMNLQARGGLLHYVR